MDYGAIVKRSWDIVKKNRFLWWLGLLALGAESGSGFGGFPGGGGGGGYAPPTDYENHDTSQPLVMLEKAKSKVLGASDNAVTNDFRTAVSWLGDHWLAVLIISIILTLIYVLIMYIAESAKAGLILSVALIEKK